MRFIIVFLMMVLAYSGYMALTTSNIQAQQAVAPVANEVQEVTEGQENEKPAEVSEDPPPQYEQEQYYEEAPSNFIEQEIANAFGNEYRLAIAIAKAESGLNPNAVHRNKDGSKDIGIFQINEKHGWSDEDMFNWKTNISIAKYLRDINGWGTWAAYNNGTYKRYL